MRLLILAPRFPWPLDRGDRLTIYKYIEFFSSHGHEVVLLTFNEQNEEIDLSKINSFCSEIIIVPHKKIQGVIKSVTGAIFFRPFQVSYYSSPKMTEEVNKQLVEKKFDVLYAHTIRMGNYIKQISHPCKILAMQVSMGLTLRRLIISNVNPVTRIFAAIEYFLVRDFEVNLTKFFTFCCIISKTDLGEMEKRGKISNSFIIPHGVDHHRFKYLNDIKKRDDYTLIFSGNMGYFPNIDAVVYFVESIFPMILDMCPDCKLLIVGRRPAEVIKKLDHHPNVHVTGEVPDMGKYLRSATIGINPMRVGSGLQNKVIEALASGLPLVVSSIANEGIGAEPERDLLIADSPEIFAKKILSLLNVPERRKILAENGRKFIERQYTWEFFLEQLENRMMQYTNSSA